MTEYKLKKDDMEFVEYLMDHSIESKFKIDWSDNDTKAKITTKEKGVIKISLPEFKENTDEIEGEIVIVTSDKGEEYYKSILKMFNDRLNDSDVAKSVFSYNQCNTLNSSIKVGDNKNVFNEIEKIFKTLGVEKINFKKNYTNNASVIFDVITLDIIPTFSVHSETYDGTGDVCALLADKVPGCKNINYSNYILPISEIDDAELIKVDDITVGVYYKKRNYILLRCDPFYGEDFTKILTLKDDKLFLKKLMTILKPIKNLDIKYIDTEEFKTELLLEEFNVDAKKHMATLDSARAKIVNVIKDYNEGLISKYNELEINNSELENIKEFAKNGKEKLKKEIIEAKKLSFINDIELKQGSIWFNFKQTTAKATLNRNVNPDGDGFGIRHIYLGNISISLTGNGKFHVISDAPSEQNNPHPHGSTSGGPCFGEGQGKDTIHKLAGQRNFTDLAMMLWMWIKRIRLGGEYMPFRNYVDDRLKLGYPVFDEKGDRILFNDPAKIKTGELMEQSLTDSEKITQSANLEKFKDYTLGGTKK